MTSTLVEELVSAYRRELSLYNDLLMICREEAAAPAISPRSAEAIELLRRKAGILGQVGQIEAEISPRKDLWERNRARSNEPTSSLNLLLSQISRALEEILRLEDEARRRFAIAEGLGLLGATSVTAARAAAYDTPAAATRLSVRG
ncbi:MAG: hypothetical protein ACKVU1_09315 [bacterium]